MSLVQHIQAALERNELMCNKDTLHRTGCACQLEREGV